jgi:hypothetical protein
MESMITRVLGNGDKSVTGSLLKSIPFKRNPLTLFKSKMQLLLLPSYI